ncbi:MAG: DUF169 domain-containing protein [Oligoflexia bacterium]|nr:DUF169 domain-containing protein [Oligoflexia bacterium]MBF0366048.1 DUF169 domain-containing protein [Oligoflexia bacterium]
MRDKFSSLWQKYFGKAEMPIYFYFTDEPNGIDIVATSKEHVCLIATLHKVRKGKAIAFGKDSFGCFGGKKFFGFSSDIRPGFEHFLSCGIPGQIEGERYKKNPEIVKAWQMKAPTFQAPKQFIAFKPWAQLEESERPEAVIFFAPADVLSALFTLAGFAESDPNSVIAPFSAGCSSIVTYPYIEERSDHPRSILGMFDVTARPCVESGILSFAIPFSKFTTIVNDMEESFLITDSWKKVYKRLI